MNLEPIPKPNNLESKPDFGVNARFEVLILGCNSASFANGRHHTSQLLRIGSQHILIDCGEGTQLRLNQEKISFFKISHIFISHLHGDHYLGLMGLVFSMQLQGRKQVLDIFGPAGLLEILTLQMKYSNTLLDFALNFTPTDSHAHYLLYENEGFKVYTLPLDHRIDCCGFLFEQLPGLPHLLTELLPPELAPADFRALKLGENIYDKSGNLVCESKAVTRPAAPPRKYAYCSDTKFSVAIIEWIKNADLLYHESTFDKSMEERATQTFHSTSIQAATIALEAGVGRLLLGHYSSRYRDPSVLLEEAVSVFGASQMAREGQVYQV